MKETRRSSVHNCSYTAGNKKDKCISLAQTRDEKKTFTAASRSVQIYMTLNFSTAAVTLINADSGVYS